MRAYDLIWKKRQGEELTGAELAFFISGLVDGTIPDYQISAWCMAVFFQGMSLTETATLTMAMVNSGATLDLSTIPGVKVDKHSTGGVGDKTSLVLLPLLAACGLKVAKLSGRGLGHSGGTLDKLEAIPGFRTGLTSTEFLDQVKQIGIALAGQTTTLVPADKKLYGLRDLTATIESVPLIASSIVSKKLAAGADVVLLDVKFGGGALIQDYDQARALAQTMVGIGNRAGRSFRALLSNMNQPLGQTIGNSLEMVEAIQTLKGAGPPDLVELCLALGGHLLYQAGTAPNFDSGREQVAIALSSGGGLVKLREWITAQGGMAEVIEQPELLPVATIIEPVAAPVSGWVEAIDCRNLGRIAMCLGAGRIKLEDQIRPEVGLKLQAKIGDRVERGAILAEVHGASPETARAVVAEVVDCFQLSQQPVARPVLLGELIG